MFTGFQEDLEYALKVMKKDYEIKNRGVLGPDDGDLKEIDMLGRILKYKSTGISWQADPRHRKMIIEHFGFKAETKALAKNGIKEEIYFEGEHEAEELQKAEEKGFRALAARANYMAVDVPNIQFPTKEVCRDMSKPSEAAYEKSRGWRDT